MGWADKVDAKEVCVDKKIEPNPCGGIDCYHGQCFLLGNIHLNCTCEDGWIGENCDQCCNLTCINGGYCDIDESDNKLFCNCPLKFTGRYCENIRSTTTAPVNFVKLEGEMWNEYTIPVVSITLFVGIVLFLLAAVIPYIMYKKRSLLILKILYRFKKFEDDDSRRYDVFLSYRTSNKTDRDFVIYKLLRQIESWGLQTCIDERDFIPGGAIPETIKTAIRESRRTILVLSPAYIEGAWPEFEVQCAVFESISKAHRIIPVIFEPIDSCKDISHTLKHILESITYIEWPLDEKDDKAQEEFWRRLKLSMPKKKAVTPLSIIVENATEGDDESANRLLFPPGMIAGYNNKPES